MLERKKMVGGKKAKKINLLRRIVVTLQTTYQFNGELELRIWAESGEWIKAGGYGGPTPAFSSNKEGVHVYGSTYIWPDVFKMWGRLYA